MDYNFIAAVLRLKGKTMESKNVAEIGKLMNMFNGFKSGGMNNDSILNLLCMFNPNIRPMLTVMNKFSAIGGMPSLINAPKSGLANPLTNTPGNMPYEMIKGKTASEAPKDTYKPAEVYTQFIQYNNFKKDDFVTK